MDFLVDRCAGRRLTQWLQGQGHDALDARELGPDPGDRALLERAVSENRTLITMDTATATMTTNYNLDALFADAELSFGHPGRRFDDTPEGFDHTPLLDQEPEQDYTPDEDGGVVHYGPGDQPLCGNENITAVYTDNPAGVTGCADCLELVVEDLQDHNDYLGRCLHCRQEITAQGGVEWRRVVRRPCPHCGTKGW